MNQTERTQTIDAIMSILKPVHEFSGIPVGLWIAAGNGKPGEPLFDAWLDCCQELVTAYEAEEGAPDNDSVFAQFLRELRTPV